MLVRHWMTEHLEVARPDEDVTVAWARMKGRRVRQLPVVADGKLVGIVTDRDVRLSHDPGTQVEQVMTSQPVTTAPATLVEEAAALLRGRKIGALPVIDHGKLVGIISESDLLQALVQLCHVIEPTTLIDVECEDGVNGAQRVRSVLERRGAIVPWTALVALPSGRLRLSLRVRMPIGHAPEQILEEAGFLVVSCITGGAGILRPSVNGA